MRPVILRDIPASFETERLTIRVPQPGDGAEVNAAVLESLDALRPWMPWAAGEPPTVEESEANLREALAKRIALDRGDDHTAQVIRDGRQRVVSVDVR